jgi:hypothetical protein
VAEVTRQVEDNGGEVCFVQLVCDKQILKQRVTEESRKLHGKASRPEQMDYYFRTYDLFSPVPGRESLRIDNTDLPAEAAAQQIIDHYQLEVVREADAGL